MSEFILPYADVKRLASRLGISLDGLSEDDYAQCNYRFERFVRPVEAAIELGIVAEIAKPMPTCEHRMHGRHLIYKFSNPSASEWCEGPERS